MNVIAIGWDRLVGPFLRTAGTGRSTSRATSAANRAWVEKSVRDILVRAPFYIGAVVYRHGADVRSGTHKPIIEPEDAHAAQRAALRRVCRPPRHHRPGRVCLLARLAYCSCGLRLRGETVRWPNGPGYRSYRPDSYHMFAEGAGWPVFLAAFGKAATKP